jgi:hypothetical protein
MSRVAAPARKQRAGTGMRLVPIRSGWNEAGLVAGGSALSTVALSQIFSPTDWWPLAFISLAPWAAAVCTVHRAWLAYWLSYVAGYGFFFVNLRWLWPVTDLGFIALAAYLALYFPLAVWALRTGRRFGISVAWTQPVAWTAC